MVRMVFSVHTGNYNVKTLNALAVLLSKYELKTDESSLEEKPS